MQSVAREHNGNNRAAYNTKTYIPNQKVDKKQNSNSNN